MIYNLVAQGGIQPSGTKTINITSNGTTTEDVTAFANAQVIANVPNTYTGADEGKVVDNGSLVSQTTRNVTSNGTYDTTTNNSTVVNVPASAVDTGTKNITSNGTHDVIGYANANVAVPASAVDTGTKNITSNGTHDVVGYANASVSVPNTYTAGDEGKVVDNGALVSQTSATYTANGTYNTTTHNSVTVLVDDAPTLQNKSVSYTPTESVQTDTVTADPGYDGLSSVGVTVGAISDTYVGSAIDRRTSSDLTASGATVTAPAGYYENPASKAIANGSATTPATTITANPSISVSAGGLITATASDSQSVTPSVTPGYVSSGTAGTVSVSGSKTQQLSTQAATTITPTTSSQTAVAAGKYTTGAVTVGPIPPQYIIPSGTKSITSNGNGIDVTAYADVDVNVPNTYSAGDEGKVVSSGALVSQTTRNVTSNGTYDTTTNNSTVVNVPNTYAAGDEGKVVSGGELVSQTSATYTTNATYDTTLINSVTVNVSGGGGGVTIVDTPDVHGGTIREITAEVFVKDTLSVSSNGTYTAPSGTLYDEVEVTVPTGTARSASDLTVSGDTVTVPAGLYSTTATKSVASGSATTPATTITANPSISVSGTGLITATTSASQSVTPTVSAGYVSSGTAGTITVNGSNTSQLTTQGAQTIHPSTTNQTINSGRYLTGNQTFNAVTHNLTADKIVQGFTAKIGDSSDDDCVASIVGTASGGSSKNVQAYRGYDTTTATSYTATDVTVTVAKTGTYNVSWMGYRNTNTGTSGSQLYKNGTAVGSASTTFVNTYGHSVSLSNQSFNQGDVLVVRARARSAQYVMGVGNLIIEEV